MEAAGGIRPVDVLTNSQSDGVTKDSAEKDRRVWQQKTVGRTEGVDDKRAEKDTCQNAHRRQARLTRTVPSRTQAAEKRAKLGEGRVIDIYGLSRKTQILDRQHHNRNASGSEAILQQERQRSLAGHPWLESNGRWKPLQTLRRRN